MRRIVSVWLPDWPITVWSRTAGPARPEPGPIALVERTAQGLVLTAANSAARAFGLRRGQTHADACAILPTLETAPADPASDRAALERLALWAERFSPCVAADELVPGFEGLLLDVSGAAHLFGGEEALLFEIERRLQAAAIPARAAIADAPGAAWALARFSEDRIAPPGRAREALADLPMGALRLDETALSLLRRFGLKRIGNLYGLPRAGLARRFSGEAGMRLVRRLDQALGIEAEPLQPVRPVPLYRAWRAFPEPIIDIAGIAHVLPPLIEALAVQLERDGKGARRLVLTAFRVDGRTTAIEAGLSAAAAKPEHLLRLLKERGLERLDLGFGADALMVAAAKAETAGARQGDLDRRDDVGAEALSALVDRIEARLGEGAALAPILRDSHIPERSEAWTSDPPPLAGEVAPPGPTEGRPEDRLRDGGDQPRPLFLFDPPEPVEAIAELPDGAPARFVWRRAPRRVVKAEGPERLSPEWWKPGDGAWAGRSRDYYRVEDEDGRRYWLYRDGLYGREDAERAPAWWMHGVFA